MWYKYTKSVVACCSISVRCLFKVLCSDLIQRETSLVAVMI